MGHRFVGWIRRHPIISGIFGGFWLLIILLAVFAPKKDTSTVTPAAASASPTVSATPTASPSPTPAATTAPATSPLVGSTPPAATVAAATHQVVVPATQPVQAPAPAATQAAPPATQAPTSVYYANCTEARAAGAAPIQQGQPGYRSALDRDHDGVACETN